MVQGGVRDPPPEGKALPNRRREILGERLDLEQALAACHQPEQDCPQQRAEWPALAAPVAWVLKPAEPGLAQPLVHGADDSALESCVRHPDLLVAGARGRASADAERTSGRVFFSAIQTSN